MSETFDDWYLGVTGKSVAETESECSERIGARLAWNHQQAKIDELEAKAQRADNLITCLQAERTGLESSVVALEADVKQLRDAFGHHHVGRHGTTDTCGQCGLDLRNPIHLRVGQEPAPPIEEEKG